MACRPWMAVMVLLAAACDGTIVSVPLDATIASDAGPPSVQIGTGQEYWEDIPVSGAITLIHGPQGGWMVYGRARITGFSPDVYLTFTVTADDGGATINTPQPLHRVDHLGLEQVNNDYESSAPELVIFTQVTAANQVVGNHYTLSLTVTQNGSHRTASTSRDIVIQYDPPM